MYKDLYKRANDSIETSDAKMRVMARLQKAEKRSVPVKRVSQLAALAACLLVTVAALNIYNDFEKEQSKEPAFPYIQDAAVVPTALPTATPEVVEAEATPQPAVKTAEKPKQLKTAQKTAEPKNVAKTEVIEPPKETAEIEQTAAQEPIACEFEDINNTAVIEAPKEAEIVINEGIPEASAPMPAAFSRNIGKIEEVTLSEYYEYIGKDVAAAAKLPDGFALNTQDAALLEVGDDGAYKSDEWCFIFENEEKSVEIITTKKTDSVSELIEDEAYQKSVVCEKPAVVFKEDDFYKAYMVSEEVGYTVGSTGLSEDEISELLVSLAE